MASERLYREFQNLERKIQLMLGENKSLKVKLSQSQKANRDLEEKLTKYKSNLRSYQYQTDLGKLGQGLMGNQEGSEALKNDLDAYIKKIDTCIAYLTEK
ncbi:MAG: hypothetical protein AAF789_10570 [Bacteroidota bacterium]